MPLSGSFQGWNAFNVKSLEPKPGVYALYNFDKKVIYLGSGFNLKGELSRLYDTQMEGLQFRGKPSFFKVEYNSNFATRLQEVRKAYREKTGDLPPES